MHHLREDRNLRFNTLKNYTWHVMLALVVTLLCASISSGQTVDPRTLPLADFSTVTAAGSWTFDWSDGTGGDISYGGTAFTVTVPKK